MTGHIKLENDDYDNRQAKAMQYTLAHPHQPSATSSSTRQTHAKSLTSSHSHPSTTPRASIPLHNVPRASLNQSQEPKDKMSSVMPFNYQDDESYGFPEQHRYSYTTSHDQEAWQAQEGQPFSWRRERSSMSSDHHVAAMPAVSGDGVDLTRDHPGNFQDYDSSNRVQESFMPLHWLQPQFASMQAVQLPGYMPYTSAEQSTQGADNAYNFAGGNFPGVLRSQPQQMGSFGPAPSFLAANRSPHGADDFDQDFADSDYDYDYEADNENVPLPYRNTGSLSPREPANFKSEFNSPEEMEWSLSPADASSMDSDPYPPHANQPPLQHDRVVPSSSSPHGSTASSSSVPKLRAGANYEEKNEFLQQCRARGMKYKDIKERGRMSEAESTLRGRFRSLTKPPGERVRSPKWLPEDVALLRSGVREISNKMSVKGKTTVLRDGNVVTPRGKLPWSLVSQYILDHGGSYKFGAATCRKKWDEICRR